MREFTQAEVDTFRSRLKPDPNTGCLNWTGCTQKPGAKNQLPYAIVRNRGKQMHGHRLAMMMKLNGPIPDGLHVLHSCHNATCCNIEHLRLGTPADNTADKMAAGRHRYAPLGTAISDADVISWHQQGLHLATIRKFGHSPQSIRAAFDRVGLPHPFVRRRGTYRPDQDIIRAFSEGGSLGDPTPPVAPFPTSFSDRVAAYASRRGRVLARGRVVARLRPVAAPEAIPVDIPTVPARPFHPRRDPSLLEFLSVKGVCDDGGELSARDLDRWHREVPFRRRLVRADGVSLETAARMAWEAGYFDDVAVPSWDSSDNMHPVTPYMLVAAMDRELRADYVHVWGDHDAEFFA